jgi:hypothetical protein
MTEEERAVSADNGRLALPAIVVHGGAGRFDRVRTDAHVERIGAGLSGALDAGWAVLSAGGSAVDAVVEAVAYLEDSGRFNAGRGSVTTSDGSVEFDASVMNASTGRVGAICASTWPANPVRVARKVAEIGGPPDGPTLLAGAGADSFASEQGFQPMTPAMLASATAETDVGDEISPGLSGRLPSTATAVSPRRRAPAVALGRCAGGLATHRSLEQGSGRRATPPPYRLRGLVRHLWWRVSLIESTGRCEPALTSTLRWRGRWLPWPASAATAAGSLSRRTARSRPASTQLLWRGAGGTPAAP